MSKFQNTAEALASLQIHVYRGFPYFPYIDKDYKVVLPKDRHKVPCTALLPKQDGQWDEALICKYWLGDDSVATIMVNDKKIINNFRIAAYSGVGDWHKIMSKYLARVFVKVDITAPEGCTFASRAIRDTTFMRNGKQITVRKGDFFRDENGYKNTIPIIDFNVLIPTELYLGIEYEFVGGGRSLMLTDYKTVLFDEKGRPRKDVFDEEKIAVIEQLVKNEVLHRLTRPNRTWALVDYGDKPLVESPIEIEDADAILKAYLEKQNSKRKEEVKSVEKFVPEEKATEANVTNVKVNNISSDVCNNKNLPQSFQNIQDDNVKIDIGHWSEEYIYNYLKSLNKYSSIIWMNEKEEAYQPYDFIVVENNITKYIEVKGTPSSSKNEFYISKNEWIFMFENKSNYYIYRLFNAGKKENLEIKIIEEPYIRIAKGELLPDTINLYV